MSPQKENFGHYIRKRRLELGLTQHEIAKKIGVAQNFVTYLEAEQRKPSHEMIKKVAAALSLSSDTLYLIAHPEVAALVNKRREGGLHSQIPFHLAALKNDRELRHKHEISDADIAQLASIRARGEVKSKEDYVFLLLSIRKAFS